MAEAWDDPEGHLGVPKDSIRHIHVIYLDYETVVSGHLRQKNQP